MPKARLYIFLLFFLTGKVLLAQIMPVKTWYNKEETQLKEKYYITDSITAQLNGPYTSYYASGKKEVIGHYKKNIPDSIWTYYYENGHIKMRGQLINNVPNGVWEYFYENGQLRRKGPVLKNKKEGKWQFFYENGKLKTDGTYTDNKKRSIWNYFYEDGSLKAQAFYTNDRGIYREFYPDGNLKAEGLNVAGKSDSTWLFYYSNGVIKAKGNFSYGKKEGLWSHFYDNGLTSAQGYYRNGKKDGHWSYYHENGTISSEGALRADKKEGYWKLFNTKGHFTGEGIFSNNNGTYKEFYESGKLKAEGSIENGENNGLWNYYYESGDLEGKCLFDHGSGEYTGYYPDGTLKTNGKIKNGVNVDVWKLFNQNGTLAGYYHPYYEDDKPIYKLVEKPDTERGNYSKPAYKFKNNKLRNFDPVINEYRGFILASNPLGVFMGKLPFSVEYYMQERLGYELQFQIIRKPFFIKDEHIDLNKTYSRGWDLALRQKFYGQEGRAGMFYIAHEIRFTSLNHFSNISDSTDYSPPANLTLKKHETKFEYSILAGSKWMTIYSDQWHKSSIGLTIDAFIGLGIGYRLLDDKYESKPQYDSVFGDVNTSKFAISPRIGINVGIIF